ncbi:MAG: FliA/WhiG family RNA polymerase sigma factor [Planctomycetes bacterium]|nr:FliA/WhiG family RNA polymerase sigma factor [Planctomycetota bacterium]
MNAKALEAYGATVALTREQRDALITDFLPLVHHVLGRLPLRLPTTLDRDDLFDVGVLGLMNAAASYSPTRGASFKTHAFVNIRGAILDELRKHDVVPRSRRDRVKQLDRAERAVEERLGRRATPEELAQETGLSIEQVDESLVNAHGMAMLSLEDSSSSGGGDDSSTRLMDCVSLPSSPDPANEAAQNELKLQLAAAITQLPERERRVIVLYYAEELRLKEIGAVLGITESRVSQIHSRALALLNSRLSDKPASVASITKPAARNATPRSAPPRKNAQELCAEA